MKFLRWLFGIPDPEIVRQKELQRQRRFGYQVALQMLSRGIEPMSLLKALEQQQAEGTWGAYDEGFADALLANERHVRRLLEKHHGVR